MRKCRSLTLWCKYSPTQTPITSSGVYKATVGSAGQSSIEIEHHAQQAIEGQPNRNQRGAKACLVQCDAGE